MNKQKLISLPHRRLLSYGAVSALISYSAYISIDNFNLKNHLHKVENSHKRFTPHQISNLLGKDSMSEVEFGDEKLMSMAILFVDIRDFTSITEGLTPQKSIKLVNEIMAVIQKPVLKNNGIIDKHLGDGLMALFPSDSDSAIKSSIQMTKNLSLYNEQRVKDNLQPIRIGIGIHYGEVMVGTVGTKDRMECTVISDAVNLAGRVEQLTKFYQSDILITQDIYNNLKDPNLYFARLIDTVRVKGKQKPVSIYQILDKQNKEENLAFENGIYLFRNKHFSEAKKVFSNILSSNPNNKTAKIYIDRCEKYLSIPKTKQWSHIYNALSK